jgi:flagellar M-ring protein FliF
MAATEVQDAGVPPLTAAAGNLPAPLQRASERFRALSPTGQLLLVLGVAAALVVAGWALMGLERPDYRPLYTGLEQAEAGRVLEALRAANVPYQVDSGAVLVPAQRVHELRLDLAAQGLPQAAGRGMELLDTPQGLGTSQFMENARYQRALEGELARSVETLAPVKRARVHLALPRRTVFLRDRKEPSASVLVHLFPGRVLDRGQVDAVVHLVGSSIPELSAARVTVVDQTGRLLSGPTAMGPERGMGLSRAQFEHVQRVEAAYVSRIESILAPVVGMDRVRAQVVASLDFSTRETTREAFDPDLPALRSEQRLSEESSGPGPQGVPGALSNTPPGGGQAPEVAGEVQAGPGGGVGSRREQSTRNYELDKTVSHTRRPAGGVQRLSVAVVVDDRSETGLDGQSVRQVPRTPEEMQNITALVREAVGYDVQRGDTLNVVNASFAPALPPAGPEPPLWEQPWAHDLARQAMVYLFLLALLLFVLRPVLRALKAQRAEEREAAERELQPFGAQGEGEEGAGVLPGSEAAGQIEGPKSDYDKHLATARRLVQEDPKVVAQVLKAWLGEDG